MLLAAAASHAADFGAAHARRAATTVHGRAAAVAQAGAALILVVVGAGLRAAAAAVGLARLFGALGGLRAILADLAVATVVERAAGERVGFGGQLRRTRRAALAVRVAHVRLRARAAIDGLGAARRSGQATLALLDHALPSGLGRPAAIGDAVRAAAQPQRAITAFYRVSAAIRNVAALRVLGGAQIFRALRDTRSASGGRGRLAAM